MSKELTKIFLHFSGLKSLYKMKPMITKEKSFGVFNFEFHTKMKFKPIKGKSFCSFFSCKDVYETPTLNEE